MANVRKILVFGATGNQGGGVVNALVSSPTASSVQILAVTRNSSSASAKALVAKSSSVKLIQGNIDNAAALFQEAGNDLHSVFLVTVPSMTDSQAEERQGKGVVDAALANNVKHFVFSSIDRGGPKSDTNPTYVPWFISKHHIEQYLKEKSAGTEMTWTILRPTVFLDNFQPGFGGRLMATLWSQMHRSAVQFVSVHDIGVFATMALTHPERFKQRAISLAGAELSFADAKKIYQKLYSRPLPTTYGFLATVVKFLIGDAGKMAKWVDEEGGAADLDECQRINPEMEDFERWLSLHGKHAA